MTQVGKIALHAFRCLCACVCVAFVGVMHFSPSLLVDSHSLFCTQKTPSCHFASLSHPTYCSFHITCLLVTLSSLLYPTNFSRSYFSFNLFLFREYFSFFLTFFFKIYSVFGRNFLVKSFFNTFDFFFF